MTKFLDETENECRRLWLEEVPEDTRAKLQALMTTLYAYGRNPTAFMRNSASFALAKETVSGAGRGIMRRPSKNAEILAALEKFVFGHANLPVHIKEALDWLEDKGHQVGGKNSSSTLSAMLSNSNNWVNPDREGWRLTDERFQQLILSHSNDKDPAEAGSSSGRVGGPETALIKSVSPGSIPGTSSQDSGESDDDDIL